MKQATIAVDQKSFFKKLKKQLLQKFLAKSKIQVFFSFEELQNSVMLQISKYQQTALKGALFKKFLRFDCTILFLGTRENLRNTLPSFLFVIEVAGS